METEKKNKKIIIIVLFLIILICGAVLSILAVKGVFINTEPIYGTFDYVNSDGSIAKIMLDEQNAYFENVKFETSQTNSAYFQAVDEFYEQGIKADDEMLHDRINELTSEMNYSELFNEKTIALSEVRYIEDEKQYYYYINTPETGKYGLSMCVDLPSKTLSLAEMEFKLKK